ncbi:MAG: hypothetical protein HY681_14095 [Chloroflexi bacterium]|nr:hypothetical protein [Chloroflexota bacterium]
MRTKRKLLAVLGVVLILLVMTTLSAPSPGAAGSGFVINGVELPARIAGYEVAAVVTPADSRCVVQSEIFLVGSDPTIEAFLEGPGPKRIEAVLGKLGLNKDVSFGVSGPGISKESWRESLPRFYSDMERLDCPRLNVNNPWITDVNDSIGGSTNVNAQSVHLLAPMVGAGQSKYSNFLNNVRTNTNQLIQAGFLFPRGTGGPGAGRIVWTDTQHGLVAQTLLPDDKYAAGHDYWFTISYTSGTWWACGDDTTGSPSIYHCEPSSATGNYVVPDPATAVFFENYNTNTGWYEGFTNPTIAYGAAYYINGAHNLWTSDSRWIHPCNNAPRVPDTIGAVTGWLENGGAAAFHLEKVPLGC